MSEIYWKILIMDDDTIEPVCLQDFDEKDYNQNKFLTQKRFSSEEEIKEVIRGIYAWLGQLIMDKKICSGFHDIIKSMGNIDPYKLK